ncbi:MAG: transposase [Acidobacteriota bacterium]|nr:transposase [Acidobacteriota bacterium]
MPRRLRLEAEGCLYHVVARGNERRPVFLDDRDRNEYLRRLAGYRERFRFELLAYCLMRNHVHLAIRRGGVTLGTIMHALQSSYTQWFNRRHERVGHLFQGRYHASLVDHDRYFLALLRYIHLNPVEAGICRDPERYKWSSAAAFSEKSAPPFLDRDAALELLGETRWSALRAYRAAFQSAGVLAMPLPANLPVVGDSDFAIRAVAASATRPVLLGLGMNDLAEIFARETLLGSGAFDGRGGNRSRAVAAYVFRSECAGSINKAALFFRCNASSLTRHVRSLESELREDAKTSDWMRALIDEVIGIARKSTARSARSATARMRD